MGYNKDKDYSYTEVKDPSVIKEDIIEPATIEDIDIVVSDYVKSLNIHTVTNKGRKKVNVLWVSAERSFQMKNDPDLRDSNDVFILPSITLAEGLSLTRPKTMLMRMQKEDLANQHSILQITKLFMKQ